MNQRLLKNGENINSQNITLFCFPFAGGGASACHDMMLDPDWRNIADLIFKFIEKTIDKKSGDNYNDNYVSTQAHQGGE